MAEKRGVFKIESEVFHFPVVENKTGLSDFHKPHAAFDMPSGGPSLARQEFKEECDINEIMARYEATGVLPNVVGEPFYYDFTTVPLTMMDSMDMMRAASDAFMTLPAKVRKEFDNDAAAFVDFASLPENLDQMREWGLAPKKEAPVAAPAATGAPPAAPVGAPVAAPAQPAPPPGGATQ